MPSLSSVILNTKIRKTRMSTILEVSHFQGYIAQLLTRMSAILRASMWQLLTRMSAILEVSHFQGLHGTAVNM